MLGGSANAFSGVLEYGDRDMCNTGVYGTDPTLGATLEGLAVGATSLGTGIYGHGFPFAPSSDFAGTDQIFVGSVQTGFHDGYSNAGERTAGPQSIALDYSTLVSGAGIQSLTLGFMADDFQNAVFGQPFTARINGVVNDTLTALLNSLDQTGPVLQFVSIGLDVSTLDPSNVLTLTIDQGGDGGDGWAIDFLTIGLVEVPAPGSAVALLAGLFAAKRRKR
jgi:hypothetical protein